MARIKGSQLVGVVKALRGVLTVDDTQPGSARIVLVQYPVMCSELAAVNAGYFETALTIAGAQQAEVEVLTCDTKSARWQARWH